MLKQKKCNLTKDFILLAQKINAVSLMVIVFTLLLSFSLSSEKIAYSLNNVEQEVPVNTPQGLSSEKIAYSLNNPPEPQDAQYEPVDLALKLFDKYFPDTVKMESDRVSLKDFVVKSIDKSTHLDVYYIDSKADLNNSLGYFTFTKKPVTNSEGYITNIAKDDITEHGIIFENARNLELGEYSRIGHFEPNTSIGFYIQTSSGHKFYSIKELNEDNESHIARYKEKIYANNNSKPYVALSFEDLLFPNSDKDYSDLSFIIKVDADENIIKNKFEINIKSGSKTGEVFRGTFSYDKSNLTNFGEETILVNTISFDYDGNIFNQLDNFDSFGLPKATFIDGEFQSLIFEGGHKTNRFGLNQGFHPWQWPSWTKNYDEQYFGYLNPSTIVDGFGKVTYTKLGQDLEDKSPSRPIHDGINESASRPIHDGNNEIDNDPSDSSEVTIGRPIISEENPEKRIVLDVELKVVLEGVNEEEQENHGNEEKQETQEIQETQESQEILENQENQENANSIIVLFTMFISIIVSLFASIIQLLFN